MATIRDSWRDARAEIVHADCYPCAPGWRIPAIVVPYDDLFYIYRGRGWIERDGERLDALPGDLFWWRHGRRYEAGHDPAHPLTVFSTGFRLRTVGEADPLRAMTLPDRVRLAPLERVAIEERFVRLAASRNDAGAHGQLAAQGELLALVAAALRWSAESPAAARSGTASPLPAVPERVDPVLRWIDAHLAEPLTLAGIARQAGLGSSRLSAVFRMQTGQSPMAWVRRRRVDAARALLIEGDRTIERVARSVGFADPFLFSRVFRRLVGMSPSAYRAAHAHPFAR
ncbi:MAG: helix-turn-helix transcriptional regulator [Planctomycetes bacterium]|nr:helix-turn-helix transcriptional regulator [Planctomycetota bacterium]